MEIYRITKETILTAKKQGENPLVYYFNTCSPYGVKYSLYFSKTEIDNKDPIHLLKRTFIDVFVYTLTLSLRDWCIRFAKGEEVQEIEIAMYENVIDIINGYRKVKFPPYKPSSFTEEELSKVLEKIISQRREKEKIQEQKERIRIKEELLQQKRKKYKKSLKKVYDLL